jgi:hypothetical protein
MNAPDLARFLAPTWHEGAALAADQQAQRMRHEAAEHCAYTAMCAGIASMLVCKYIDPAETLADMLSEHTSNYRTDIEAANPCDLLASLLAESLRSTDPRVQPLAEKFARRIALDYAVAHEGDA